MYMMDSLSQSLDFGVFVEILAGKEGLLHISEIDWKHVKDAN
jgi:ribosomal protein S1